MDSYSQSMLDENSGCARLALYLQRICALLSAVQARRSACPKQHVPACPCHAFSFGPWFSGVQIEAADVRGRLLTGDYSLEVVDLRSTLHRAAGVQQLGGTLMALPFVHAPRASIRWGQRGLQRAGLLSH